MSERIWHKGPPPHVGWWNASGFRNQHVWRWWDGKHWSCHAVDSVDAETASEHASDFIEDTCKRIEWSDYYPKNARVPRIDPRSTK